MTAPKLLQTLRHPPPSFFLQPYKRSGLGADAFLNAKVTFDPSAGQYSEAELTVSPMGKYFVGKPYQAEETCEQAVEETMMAVINGMNRLLGKENAVRRLALTFLCDKAKRLHLADIVGVDIRTRTTLPPAGSASSPRETRHIIRRYNLLGNDQSAKRKLLLPLKRVKNVVATTPGRAQTWRQTHHKRSVEDTSPGKHQQQTSRTERLFTQTLQMLARQHEKSSRSNSNERSPTGTVGTQAEQTGRFKASKGSNLVDLIKYQHAVDAFGKVGCGRGGVEELFTRTFAVETVMNRGESLCQKLEQLSVRGLVRRQTKPQLLAQGVSFRPPARIRKSISCAPTRPKTGGRCWAG